ncbi:MAG: hypothetical protein AAB926_00295, partial [Patescibacteria group bacterium]
MKVVKARRVWIFILPAAGLVAFGFFSFQCFKPLEYVKNESASVSEALNQPNVPEHLKTPSSVKAIYMTSWVAGTKNWRNGL